MLPYKFNFGRETLAREFKEFTIPSGLFPQNAPLLEWCKSSVWSFNPIVEKAIINYFDQFYHKYRIALADHPNAELFIGVDDHGSAHGIPFQGDILHTHVHRHLQKAITPFTKMEWIPLSYTQSGTEGQLQTNPRLDHYLKEAEKSNALVENHQMNYTNWRTRFDKYTRKLVDLFNESDTKTEFLEYLQTRAPDVHKEVTRPEFRLLQKKYPDIRAMIQKQEGVYYWMCRWKDERLRHIRNSKPKKVSMKQRHRATRFGPQRILSKTSEMFPYWFAHNQDMRLYVLKFTFDSSSSSENVLSSVSKYKRDYIVKNGQTTEEPCCVPV